MTHNEQLLHEAKLKAMNEDDSADFRKDRARVLAWVVKRRVETETEVDSNINRLLSENSDTFVKLVVNANRVLTKTPTDDFGTNYMIPFDNIIRDANTPGYVQVLPHPEDKIKSLECIHELAIDMKALKRSPEHIAAVIGYGINLVHPFTHANGRTARMVHDSIVNGADVADERFSRLADDSADNTDLLNPGFIEDHAYQHMQLQHDTHFIEDGMIYPRVCFEVSPEVHKSLLMRTSDYSGSLSSPFDHTMVAISHPHISHMLAYFMARKWNASGREGVIKNVDGEEVFDLDIFSNIANDGDWNQMHMYTRYISSTYARVAMGMLAAHPSIGPDIIVTVDTRERGDVTLPMSQLLPLLAQQKLHR